MDDIKQIPAGQMLPPEVQETVEIEPPAEPKVFAGKYKSPEELEMAYLNAEKALGKQGGELGELRGRAKYLEEQLGKQPAPAKEEKAPVDYNSMIKSLGKQYEDGDKTFEEVLLEATSMTAQQVQAMTQGQMVAMEQQFNERLTNTLAERDAMAEADKFHKENPDYDQVVKSGTLDGIKKQNPMHDDFSAYFAWKASEAVKRAEAEATRIREGSKGTEKVLAKSGTSIQQTNKTRTSDPAELRASMMQAIAAAKEE